MERLLLPTSDFPPKRGGVARMLSTMVDAVSGMRPMIVAETQSYRSMLRMFWDRRALFDAIFVSHVLPIGSAALLYRLLTRTPYDVLLHGMDVDLARASRKKACVLWCVLRGARRVFANSHALAREVATFVHRSCDVLYPCVSREFIEASALIGARRGLGTRLLTVSRLVERKGQQKVLRAMTKLPHVSYTIVGDGPMKRVLEDDVKRLGLHDRVTFMQFVSDGKLPELYASHDMFVMPTTKTNTDREGFGIVYLEAGLFGLPVIATRQPGVDEAVLHGETGLLIEDSPEALVEAITQLASDELLRERLGTSAKQRVLHAFTGEQTYRQIGAVNGVMFERPLISVVIPTYQHARAVGDCIRSALAQTYPNIEIIVVDDGSTDNTQDVLREFGKRITVIAQKNQGGNAARNRGLSVAKGEYVLCADADVVMKPAMIEVMFEVLQKNPGASYAYSAFRFGWKHFAGVPFNAERLRRSNFIMTTSLVRKKDFPGFDPALKRFQDWDVWLTMLERGKTGVLIPGTWFSVVIDGESRTGSSWLPAFVYSLPWPMLGWTPKRIQKYREARRIIVKKHHLPV